MPAKLTYLDARVCTKAELLAVIESDGACVLTNLISPEDADAIVKEMSPFIEKTSLGNDDFAGMNTTRTGALAARSPTFNRAVLLNPLFLAAAEHTILPHAKRLQVMATQVIRIGPGSVAQPWHRDREVWGKDLLGEQVEPQMASVWALTDFTKVVAGLGSTMIRTFKPTHRQENGATRVVPKTHVRPINYDYVPTEKDICYAEMPKGSAIFYTGSAMHSGGANVTKNEWRIGMHGLLIHVSRIRMRRITDRWTLLTVSFACGWLRQEENQYLSVPPEIARTLDPAVQELLGYSLTVS